MESHYFLNVLINLQVDTRLTLACLVSYHLSNKRGALGVGALYNFRGNVNFSFIRKSIFSMNDLNPCRVHKSVIFLCIWPG